MTAAEGNERELVRRMRQGDHAAYMALYDQFSPALYGVILRMCRDRDTANDLLQQSFIKIWENRDSYDPSKGKFYTWAFRISRNVTLNDFRKRGRLIQSEDPSVYIKETDDSEELPIDVSGLLKSLEEHHRKAIELVYYKGLTHRQAHKRMDVPLGTFKSYIRQALRELRKACGMGVLLMMIYLLVNG